MACLLARHITKLDKYRQKTNYHLNVTAVTLTLTKLLVGSEQ